ncbi:MAG: CBS domain-containing protein [Deltaproteobacteria bacterium]|nr:CBS domain-containing protein [Deltaproteobacteria bacterium]
MNASTYPAARALMSVPVTSVRLDARLSVADELLRRHDVSCLAVVDASSRLVGAISRTDLLRAGRLAGGLHDGPLVELPDVAVAELMSADVVCVAPDDSVTLAASRMAQRRIHRVFVREGETAVGVISTRDIMSVIAAAKLRQPIRELMSSPVVSIEGHASVAVAADRLVSAAVRGIVVVEDGWPIGVFTQSEALLCAQLPDDTCVAELSDPAILCLPVQTPVFRAAATASALQARRVIAVDHRQMEGVLTGFDLARVLATPA